MKVDLDGLDIAELVSALGAAQVALLDVEAKVTLMAFKGLAEGWATDISLLQSRIVAEANKEVV